MTLRAVIVGLGAVGMGYDLGQPAERIRTHARALSINGAFGPVIGVDPNPERRAQFAAAYHADSFASLEPALTGQAPDVVVIATPTANHVETLRAVLDLSAPRAILCEKPLAHDPESARAMVSACERQGVQLYVNYMRRCDPAVHAVKAMIADGRIVAPVKAVVWYSKGLIHNGSHFVNLAGYWLGEVQRASIVNAGRCWQGNDPEPDFVLEYPLGFATFLAANEERFSHYTVELVAQNGRLRYERGGERVEWQGVTDDPDCAGYRVLTPAAERLPAELSRSQLNVTRELTAALRGVKASLCTGDEALATLRDIYRVIELRKLTAASYG